jgi:hypothetical protein
MRASSLSNARVIDLLNQYFIPAHADGVYYEANGNVPADEKAAYERIFQEFHRLNKQNQDVGKPVLSVGTVHAYVLSADGKPFDSLHVGQATPERVIGMLEHAIREWKLPPGKPVIKATPQSTAPHGNADSLVLHLTARYLVPRKQPGARQDVAGDFVPAAPRLGSARSGQWDALPSEDWIEWTPADWRKLLPAGDVAVGSSWDIDSDLTRRLLTRFYPTTENNDLSSNRIDRQRLRATIVSVRDGIVRAHIDGSLKMKHAFYPHRDDQNFVDAKIIGYMDFELATPRIVGLRLVTDEATYGGNSHHFGVAVRSVASSSK